MSSISRLILVQADDRASAAMRFAFEREGILVAALPGAEHVGDALAEPAALVIAGARDRDEATATLAAIRGAVDKAGARVPVLYVGNGIGRTQALAEGAAEFLGEPAFVRDVVTVARLVAGRRPEAPAVFAGELGEHFGMFFLVRAIVSLRRRGVLTIVRGLRRGELRFYDGEVTSAQVGVLHGQAALHQLLLWTEGRFELRPENVVRRRQIPLDPPELLADCERFLTETRQVAERLSPAALYACDQARARELGQPLPEPVDLVWRLFDGSRTLADVVEDSPFRMFETLRVANQLAHLGLLREGERSRPARRPHGAAAALAIEEWLGGTAVRRGDLVTSVDWAALVPQAPSEHPSPPSVVPSTVAAGEISVGSSDRARRASEPPVAAPAREGVEGVGAARLQSLFVDPAALDGARTVPFQRVEPEAGGSADEDAVTDPVPKVDVAPEATAVPSVVASDRSGPTAAASGEIVVPRSRSTTAPPAVDGPAVVVAEEAAPIMVMAPPSTIETGPVPIVPVAVLPPDAEIEPPQPVAPRRPPSEGLPIDTSDAPDAASHTTPFVKVALAPEPAPAAGAAAPNRKKGKKDRTGRHRKLPAAKQPAAAAARQPEPVGAGARQPALVGAEAPATARQPEPALAAAAPVKRERARSKGELDAMIRTADGVFSADEEAFFSAGAELETRPPPPGESFDDLDEGYEVPKTFWQRLLRKPNQPFKKK